MEATAWFNGQSVEHELVSWYSHEGEVDFFEFDSLLRKAAVARPCRGCQTPTLFEMPMFSEGDCESGPLGWDVPLCHWCEAKQHRDELEYVAGYEANLLARYGGDREAMEAGEAAMAAADLDNLIDEVMEQAVERLARFFSADFEVTRDECRRMASDEPEVFEGLVNRLFG